MVDNAGQAQAGQQVPSVFSESHLAGCEVGTEGQREAVNAATVVVVGAEGQIEDRLLEMVVTEDGHLE